MTDEHARPPRLAETLLRVVVRPRDAAAIAGDLLEEYRVVKRPALGRRGADVWYMAQVFGILGRLIAPFAITLLAARALLLAFTAFPLAGHWNPSLIPAPNVSLLDGLLFLTVGYSGARQTGRLATGVVSAAALGVIDFGLFALAAAFLVPTLATAITEKPFILVIGTTFVAIAMVFAVTLGTVGAAFGSRHAAPSTRSDIA